MQKDIHTALTKFSLDPALITDIDCLREHTNHATYRICLDNQSVILKLFVDSEPVEIEAYQLLSQYKVATLPVLGIQEQAILLQDISTGGEWRLANQEDASKTEVGTAVAEWYRTFHAAGCLAVADHTVSHLKDWLSVLTPDSLSTAGKKLNIQNEPAWQSAIRHIDFLKTAVRAQPQTFNYNDFYYTNLALSRDEKRPLSAIIFDYDLFSLGPVYSDWRNVTSSLYGEAKEAFIETYGPVDESQKAIYYPLSIMEELVVASQRTTFPKWANLSKKAVLDGTLNHSIQTTTAVFR